MSKQNRDLMRRTFPHTVDYLDRKWLFTGAVEAETKRMNMASHTDFFDFMRIYAEVDEKAEEIINLVTP